MKKVIWFIFICLGLGMGFQSHVLKYSACPRYSIIELETACKCKGEKILSTWNNVKYGKGTLLDVAKSNTHWDFLFIVCYVLLLLLHSSDQMQREKWLWLNALLRLNLFLAVLAGLLDVGENLFLLHDFRHVADGRYYVETLVLTLPKFVFSFFAAFVFLVSWLKSVIQSWIVSHKQRSIAAAV